jgi:hypothetical protein
MSKQVTLPVMVTVHPPEYTTEVGRRVGHMHTNGRGVLVMPADLRVPVRDRKPDWGERMIYVGIGSAGSLVLLGTLSYFFGGGS